VPTITNQPARDVGAGHGVAEPLTDADSDALADPDEDMNSGSFRTHR
jgi:hypothetical protein